MSIHQTIFDTLDQTDLEVFDLIGGGSIDAVTRRRQRMREFLKNNKFDEDAYKLWVRNGVVPPKKLEMAKNLAFAARELAKQGIEYVDDQEKERRESICATCEFAMQDGKRCGKCGCFLKWKVKMKAWHCPIDRW